MFIEFYSCLSLLYLISHSGVAVSLIVERPRSLINTQSHFRYLFALHLLGLDRHRIAFS